MVNEMAEMKVFEVGFSGGEPLLRRDLFKLLTALKDKRIRTYLCTNGLLVNDDITQQISESKVPLVLVSLDGASAKTHDSIRGKGTYRKAIRGIERLVNSQVRTIIMTTLMAVNVGEISSLIRKAERLGVSGISLFMFFPFGRSKQYDELLIQPSLLKKTIEKLKDEYLNKPQRLSVSLGGCLSYLFRKDFGRVEVNPCGVGNCAIGPEGHVRPCLFLPLRTEKSVREVPLKRIWLESRILKSFRHWEVKKSQCNLCSLQEICNRRCRALHAIKYRFT